jgi:Domain of unknown function (DUF1844)
MADDLRDRNAQLFVSLVIGLVQAAYVQLGKVRNELTGQVDRNLEAARITIDTLAALELKTKGNLAPEEADVLRRALTELRMNFVDELKKESAAPAAEAGAGASRPAVTADDGGPPEKPVGDPAPNDVDVEQTPGGP